MADKPIYITVGFKCADHSAFDALWQHIRTTYHWMQDGDAPIQAFAVSKGDMFAEQDATDALINSDLDIDEMRDAIRAIPCNTDLPAHLAAYGVSADSL